MSVRTVHAVALALATFAAVACGRNRAADRAVAAVDPPTGEAYDGAWCWRTLPATPDDGEGGVVVEFISTIVVGGDLWLAYSGHRQRILRWNQERWDAVEAPPGRDVVLRGRGTSVFAAERADGQGASAVQVWRRDETNWTPLGPPVDAYPERFTNGGGASLVLDTSERPLVVWNESRPRGGGARGRPA